MTLILSKNTAPNPLPELEQQFHQGMQPLNRRQFLKQGLILGVMTATTFSTACSTLMNQSHEESDVEVHPLSVKERQVFNKLVETLLPINHAVLPDWQTIPVMNNLESVVVNLDSATRADLKLAVSLFNLSPLFMSIKLRTISVMDKKDVEKIVRRWERGLFMQRGVITSLKTLVYMSYWRDESTWSALEYDGPVTEQWGIKRLGNQPLPLS